MLNSLTAFAAFAGVLITVLIGASLAMCWYEQRMLGTRPPRRTAAHRPPRPEVPEPAPVPAAEQPPPLERTPEERIPGADRAPAAVPRQRIARRITPTASAGVALLALLLTVASRSGRAHPLLGTDRHDASGKPRASGGSPAQPAAAGRGGAGLRRLR